MIVDVRGAFRIFDANIYTSERDFTTAEVDLWIDASSITTGDAKRDAHLKSIDFFNVENHKQITFTSSTMGKADKAGNHELWGELTIKGITRKVKLNVRFGGIAKDPWGKEKAGFTVTGMINRKDWGLIWNQPIGSGGLMVSEEVVITCEVELTAAGSADQKIELELSSHENGIA